MLNTFIGLLTWYRSLNSTIKRIFVTLVLVLTAFGVGHYYHPRVETQQVVVHETPTTRTVEVPVEHLTTKVVTKYVPTEDKAAVESLMKENAALKVQVEGLTVSLATATSTTNGPAVVTEIPATPTTPTKTSVSFKDWRLSFNAEGDQATYTLAQKFVIANTIGKDAQNAPTSTLKLFELGAKGEQVEIPITNTTYITGSGPQPHVYPHFTLQAGIDHRAGLPMELAAALVWLHHGKTTDPADTRWSFLSPAVSLNSTQRSIGFLPVSLNIGTLPGFNKVLSNVWVSPYIGKSFNVAPTTPAASSTVQGFTLTFQF